MFCREIRKKLKSNYKDIEIKVKEYIIDMKLKKKEYKITIVIYLLMFFVFLLNFWKNHFKFLGENVLSFISRFRVYIALALFILRPILINKMGVNQNAALEIYYNGTKVFSGITDSYVPDFEIIKKRIDELKRKQK